MKKIVLITAVLIFGLTLTAIFLLRSDFVSQKILVYTIAELEKATGHRVKVEEAAFNLIPTFIELKGIELFDNEGNPIIKIKRVKGYIGLGRPLQRELSVRVKVANPSLIIERSEEGIFNLSPLIEAVQKYLKEEQRAPVKMDLRGISAEKGEIDFLDKRESLSILGKDLSFNLRTGFLHEGSRINARADDIRLKIKTLPDLALKAETRFTVRGSRFTVQALEITNVGSSIGVEGNLNLSKSPAIDIRTKIVLIAKSFKEFLGLKEDPKGELRLSGKIKGDMPVFEKRERRVFPEVDLDMRAEIPVSLLKTLISIRSPLTHLHPPLARGELKGGWDDFIEGIITVKGNLKGKYPELVSKGEISLSEGELSGIRIKKVESGFSSQFTARSSQFTFSEIKGEILEGKIEGRLTGRISERITEPWAIEGDGWLRYIKMKKETKDEGREARGITPSMIEKAEVTFSSKEGLLAVTKANISTPLSFAETSGSLSLKTLEGEFPFRAHSENFGEWVDPYYLGTKGTIDITGKITGPIRNPEIDGRAEIISAEVKGVPIQRAYGSVRYKEKEIAVSAFQIEQEGSNYLIDGSIRFGQEGPYYNAKAKIKNGNPRKITSIFYKDLPIDTSINGEMAFRGGNLVYEGEANLNLNKGRAYGQDFDKAKIKANLKRVQGSPGEINFPSINIEKGGDLISADGRIGFDESFHGTISSKRIALGNINILNQRGEGGYVTKEMIGGFTSLKISGKGTFKKPDIIADLKLYNVSYRILNSIQDFGDGDMEVSLKEKALKLLTRVGGLRFEGEMAITDGLPWYAAISLKDFRVENFFINNSELKNQDSGKVSIITTGSIKAEGRGTDPGRLSLTARLSSIGLNIFGYKINSEDALIGLNERDLRVHSLRLKGPEGSSIEIGGDLRLNDFYNLYLYGKADLGLLRPFIPQIESLSGNGEFMVALSDRWKDPQIQGMIEFKDGTVKIRDLPQRIGRLSGTLSFEKERIILDSLQGEFGGGRLDFSGLAVLKGLSFRNFYIQGKAEGVRYRYFEGLTTTFDGRVIYEGDARSQTLSGEIMFKRALYTRRIDWKSWLLELRKIEEKPKVAVSPLMNTNLNVYLSGKVDVDNNIGKGPVSIDILLKGTPIRPLFFGRIESNEGQIFFRNNSFRVISASADFFDPNRIYPIFNIIAVTDLKGYRIHLTLNGPIDRFSLSLSSDPPLSETDLIALLTVGQPSRGLKGLEAGVGASEAASFLTGKLQDVLEEKFRKIAGLDRFQVDPYITRSSSAGGPRLTVGKGLMNGRLYMTYSANIGTSEEQVIRLEYILGRNISLVGVRDEQGQIGGDLKFRFEFR